MNCFYSSASLAGQATCSVNYTEVAHTSLSNFWKLSILFISFIWLSSLVLLPEVRRKTKAKSYCYVSWCRYAPYYARAMHRENMGQNLLECMINGLLYVSQDLPGPRRHFLTPVQL